MRIVILVPHNRIAVMKMQRSLAGSHPGSPLAHRPGGTMAQDGNVFEWTESDLNQPNGPVTDNRILRGGYWGSIATHLMSSTLFNTAPTVGDSIRGFRVATSVPEPSAAALVAIAIVGMLGLRKSS